MDLALNNLQRLICHKNQQTKPKISKNGIDGWFFMILIENFVQVSQKFQFCFSTCGYEEHIIKIFIVKEAGSINFRMS